MNYPDSFALPPDKALPWFRAKGLKASFRWTELLKEEHNAAFTIAKMLDMDLLADVKKAVDDALGVGMTLKEFRESLKPLMQAKGWWGKTKEGDQLGSPHRLEVIFRTNLQTAYAAQYWDTIEKTKEARPYLLYDAVDDARVRPEHAAWDGIILPADDKFWKTHTPPNGWMCRCTVIQLDDGDLKSLGVSVSKSPRLKYYDWENPETGKVERIPEGIDPGWDYNVGKGRLKHLAEIEKEKVANSPLA